MAEGTVFRIKRRFAEEGLAGSLWDRRQANRHRKLDERGEAHLIAPRSWPRAGSGLQYGPRRARPLDPAPFGGQGGGIGVDALPIPRDGAAASEKTALKLWQKQEWCIPKVSAEFVAHMEDVLDLYAEPYDPQRPVVCFDETSTQLLAETRPALPAQPGLPRRQDYEYRREGTPQPVPGL